MQRYRVILAAALAAGALSGAIAKGDDADPSDPCPVVTSEGNGVFVGMVSDQLFADPDPEYRRCALNKHAEAGVRIIRQALLWKSIERRRDTYDWDYWDAYVGALAEHGIHLMPIIFDAPRWRQQPRRRSSWAAMPPKPGALARFAARLVRRYGPEGTFWLYNPDIPAVPIRAWQVWNEPNLPRYWAEQPNAAEYVRVLRATRDAIKAEDPEAEVVAAGMPDSRLSHAVPLITYITQMYEAGGLGAFDDLAVNAYADSPREMMRNLGDVRAIMRHFGDKSRIWITELGWGTGGPRYRFRVSKAQQGTLLGQALRKLETHRRILRIRGFIHYMWQDAPPYGDTPDFWGLHTGLLDIDGREKPAYGVFSRIAQHLRWLR